MSRADIAKAMLASIALGALLLIVTAHHCVAQDMPAWVIKGMLARESSSMLRSDGTVVYVNQRRGIAGEVGATQALPTTLRQFGFSPSLFEQDTAYCVAATTRILTGYRARFGSWEAAVGAWRKGPGKRDSATARAYVAEVRALGGAQ